MITRRAFQAGLLSAAWSLDDARAETAGTWSTLLATGSLPRRLKVELGADGAARLFGLDQGSAPIPGRVTVTGDQIRLEFPGIKAVFQGRMASRTRIEGTWRQGGSNVPLVFNRGEAALGPPPPAPPLTHERLAELRTKAGAPAMGAASAGRHSAPQIWVDGERIAGSGIAVEPTDQWHLGSITKSMTASLIGRLVDQGTCCATALACPEACRNPTSSPSRAKSPTRAGSARSMRARRSRSHRSARWGRRSPMPTTDTSSPAR